jgi:3-isopropylmalate/(R)-2-methylmalate dehydratase small subunit
VSVRKFQTHTGIAVPMLQPNIDTDAIMPSREMKRVSRSGLGSGLFAGWRYLDRGTETERENPEFILNQPGYRGASIILAGRNMGCGSSREFAVWALADFGIRAIIAPSFGAIFRTNCIRNGVLPVTLGEAIVAGLSSQVEVDPQRHQVSIDLVNKQVQGPNGERYPFEIDSADQKMLIDGLDQIDVTMKSIVDIEKYESLHRSIRSWVHLT